MELSTDPWGKKQGTSLFHCGHGGLWYMVVYLHGSFSKADINKSKAAKILNPKIKQLFLWVESLDFWRLNSYLVCFVLIRRRKSVKNNPLRNLKLLSPPKRYKSPEGGIWNISCTPIFNRPGVARTVLHTHTQLFQSFFFLLQTLQLIDWIWLGANSSEMHNKVGR